MNPGILLSALIFLITSSLYAQQRELPHYLTPEEKASFEQYRREQTSLRSIPTPPPGEVRTMAEWEEVQAVIITWASHSSILREIVRHASKECKVLIITTNPANVSNQLTSNGISLDSVRFIDTPFNSIWVRDYGPWTVYQNDVDSLYLVDWVYNRPRPQDDQTPAAIAAYLDIPIYEATNPPDDWVHTGGNHLPDGLGTAFSSMLVLEENNDKTEDEIDSIAGKYLGVKQYIKFPTLPYDGIHHLDMHMRIIDEETILFGEYPEGVADGPQINANINALLTEFNTSFGNQYRIVRLPMPPDAGGDFPDEGGDYRTYTNSIFINKTILVPVYEEKYDSTALRIYRENLPGYNVVGINCNSIIPSLGALHCITKLVGVNEPLLIAHAKLRDTENPDSAYRVNAVIRHVSGIERADLYFKQSADSIYQRASMLLSDTSANIWRGEIPPYSPGTEVQYYIHAYAFNGKEQVRPIVAPEGYFYFRILGDPINLPPSVEITQPSNGAVLELNEGLLNILITAADPDGDIDHVVLYINGDSVTAMSSLPYAHTWTFTETGLFELVASAQDDDGLVAFSDTVRVSIESTTSVSPAWEDIVTLLPNPVTELLRIKSTGSEINAVNITDAVGRLMPVSSSVSGNEILIDLSSFPVGIYTIRMKAGNHWLVRKLIKI